MLFEDSGFDPFILMSQGRGDLWGALTNQAVITLDKIHTDQDSILWIQS